MATPTRPCPYCGAAVLMNAAACGTCGRPMPAAPAGPPMGGGGPAKTMFGYAAPVRAPMPAQPQPPTTGMQPPRPAAPPQQPGYPPAPQQPGYPPQQQPGYPPAQAQQPGYPPAQPQQPGYPPAQQPGYPPAPHAMPPQPPMQQPGYPPAPQQPGYPPAPQQPGYPPAPPQPQAMPPQQPGYPPQQPGYPPQQPGYPPQQPGYPPQQGANPFGAPQQDLPGPLDNMARHIPQSAPGTLFGMPLAKLRDDALQKKFLFLAGVALLVSIVVPVRISPTVFMWSSPDKFPDLIWPIIAGAIFLFLTVAPSDTRQKVPPVVLHWTPFGTSFAGLVIVKPFALATMAVVLSGFGPEAAQAAVAHGWGFGGGPFFYTLAYTVLVFGLLARLAAPNDPIARIFIGAGAGMMFPAFFDTLDFAFHFGGMPFLVIIHNLLFFCVMLISVGCLLFVINGVRVGTVTIKLPPALAALDAFMPAVTALLIVWPVVQALFVLLVGIVHSHQGVSAILASAHILLPVVAYFGALMVTGPAAYDALVSAISKNKGGGAPPPPQQGGGYPPQGGGYPPQGGGYPPQGGGYPPQGGGYPPQGGGYPPQGGGGWPQQ